jgi:aminopeptidase N
MQNTLATYLKDYQAHSHRIETIDLTFHLHPTETKVITELVIMANSVESQPLVLNGEQLTLSRLLVDGELLPEKSYQVDATTLTIDDLPSPCRLTIETIINPQANTDLEGLYLSGGKFCTQCEPHGFRRITYFIDRPDNLSRFTTTLIANKQDYPILLANGNCVRQGDLENDCHFATWEDPFLKPSYLFALVAGKLDLLEDKFTTMSGRTVDLKLYVDPGQADKAHHAMDSLKKSMKWDEEVYGREYDLDIFMIVAVRDFNMGAMENKGLNIFNSKYILANPESATDKDYESILVVVGHEYFHNWSGNRVTCRDWFQLSLKEGFTVFRDQTFSADHTSEAIKRIDDVNLLRTHQFAEDAGPTAHSVQPESYLEMNNFYTMTIYNKGAEIVRMLHTLLGEKLFRKATDLYFDRHDGQAVTIEEFVAAMEDAANIDLSQFRLWYSQAGTPELTITEAFDANKQEYSLLVKQSIPDTPGQSHKKPMHIPLAIGLLDEQGHEILKTTVLNLTEKEQRFCFDGITAKPIPSLLRGFSAPVKLSFPYNDKQLALLMVHDADVFARYEAAQTYVIRQIESVANALATNKLAEVDTTYLAVISEIAHSDFADKALQALLLTLPSEKYVIGLQQEVNPLIIHQAREILRFAIAESLQERLQQLYANAVIDGEYNNNATDNAARRLKNVVLSYLTLLDKGECAWQQFNSANNMTDKLAAMTCLVDTDSTYREQALDSFYQQWQHDANVMDKWFAVQAMASSSNALSQVKSLMTSKAYDAKNPNVMRALLGSFAENNIPNFHAEDGSGYKFLAEQIINTDKFNKHVASRLVTPFLSWRKYDKNRQAQMRKALESIIAVDDLSKNTYELVDKALK